jgi:arylsulfatase A-like enzyme
MTDDVGFAAPSTFGGVIPTLALEGVVANGLWCTNFHSTSLCSRTRAALITGHNKPKDLLWSRDSGQTLPGNNGTVQIRL